LFGVTNIKVPFFCAHVSDTIYAKMFLNLP
jgi:hypothetical protein